MVIKWTESMKERKLEADRRNLKDLCLLPYLPAINSIPFYQQLRKKNLFEHESNGLDREEDTRRLAEILVIEICVLTEEF
jgi:hypothetical protein